MTERQLSFVGIASGLLAVGFLIAAFQVKPGDDMAKAKSKADKLIKTACDQIAAKDYDGAIETCVKLQPLNAAEAHRIRGDAYEGKGCIDEAIAEYDASYANHNHVAGGSAAFLRKEKAAGKKVSP